MPCLAIDTAGPVCAAAVARDHGGATEILSRCEERIGRGHAERLVPMIGEVLEAAGLAYADLDRIAVSAGPGSFTGVRIGVAAARGLALALDVPAFGIDVLAVILASVRGRDATEAGSVDIFVAALDARRDAVYLRAEDRSGALLMPSAAVSVADVGQALRPFDDRPIVISGSGASMVSGVLGGNQISILDEADHADIAAVAALGLAGSGASPPVPLYLRPSDARPQPRPALAKAAR